MQITELIGPYIDETIHHQHVKPMKTLRLFIALPLPAPLRDELAALSLAAPAEGLRWTKPENLHVTLLFLGSVPESEVPVLITRLSEVNDIAPFLLQCSSVKAISRRGSTSMLWAAFEPSPSFTRLAEKVAEATRHPPDKAPLPHSTLARAKREFRGKIEDRLFPGISHLLLEVTCFELWESLLKPQGADYHCLHRFRLTDKQ